MPTLQNDVCSYGWDIMGRRILTLSVGKCRHSEKHAAKDVFVFQDQHSRGKIEPKKSMMKCVGPTLGEFVSPYKYI